MSAGLLGFLIGNFLMSLIISMIIVVLGRKVRKQKLIYGVAAVVTAAVAFAGAGGAPLYVPSISVVAVFLLLYWSFRRRQKRAAVTPAVVGKPAL